MQPIFHRIPGLVLLLLAAGLVATTPAMADVRVVRPATLDVSGGTAGTDPAEARVLRVGGSGAAGAYLRFASLRLPAGRVVSARLRVYKLSRAPVGARVRRLELDWPERLEGPRRALLAGSRRFGLPARSGRGWIGADATPSVRRGRRVELGVLPASRRLLRLASRDAGVATAPRLVIRVRVGPGSPGAGEPFARRPYSDSSPWNTPIGPSPDVHPRSAAGVAAIGGPRVITSDPTQYTYPVYIVDGSSPLSSVQLSGVFSDVRGSATEDTSMRFLTGDPLARVPLGDDFRVAAGSDAQLVVVNAATGDEWGFWRLQRSSSGEVRATNGYHYNVGWDGVPPRGGRGQAFGSRGAGVPYLAGLVRPFEIRQGRIDHALAFAFGGDQPNDFPSSRFIYPASKSDGSSNDPDSLPEGARLQLDPGLTQAQLRARGCGSAALVIAEAMQRYGMYVIDQSGSTKIMLESTATAGADWASLGVGRSTASCIPLDRMRWVR